MNDRYQTYRTAIGCCADLTDELLVEAFYATPTAETAAPVAALLNERGYRETAETLLEGMYQ